MTQVKDKTDQQLNRALAELMGWTNFREGGHEIVWGDPPDDRWTNMMPDYCTDPAASLEVQKAGCKDRFYWYIQSLSKIVGADGYWDSGSLDYEGIALLLNASPRERAEAAYITLNSK